MFSSSETILLLVFASIAYPRSLPPQSLPIHAPNATEKSMQQNETLEEFSNLNAATRFMMEHGQNMPRDSCQIALSMIPQTADRKIFIQRSQAPRTLPPDHVTTPIRYLSDDGLCAIDVILAPVSTIKAAR